MTSAPDELDHELLLHLADAMTADPDYRPTRVQLAADLGRDEREVAWSIRRLGVQRSLLVLDEEGDGPTRVVGLTDEALRLASTR